MVVTKKEFRWHLAHKYHDRLRKVDETLDFLSDIWYWAEELKAVRERLISNLQTELSTEDWYEEAKTSHRAEHKAKRLLHMAEEEEWKLEKEYKEKMAKADSDALEKDRLEKEYKEKMAKADSDIRKKRAVYDDVRIDYRGNEDVVWGFGEQNEDYEKREKKEKILKDLKENHVKIEENVEMMWYKWKKVYINLPAVWSFEWFKFEYFISENTVYGSEITSELNDKLYSIRDISQMLKAMNRYMKALGVETDGYMDYERYLLDSRDFWQDVKVWDCFKSITGLDCACWLDNGKNGIIEWNCHKYVFYFNTYFDMDPRYPNIAHLFLRLS